MPGRVFQRLRRLLPEASTLVDVGAGAYEGPDVCYACQWSLLWPAALIVAFEPDEAVLARTSALSPDLRWVPAALSNVTGTARLAGAKPNTASLSTWVVSGHKVDEFSGHERSVRNYVIHHVLRPLVWI